MDKLTENHLIQLYQCNTGNVAMVALSKLFIANADWLERRILSHKRKFALYLFDDIRQEAYLAFVESIKCFDLSTKAEVKLSTYAGYLIDWAISKMIKSETYKGLKPPSMSGVLRKQILAVISAGLPEQEQRLQLMGVAFKHNVSIERIMKLANFLGCFNISSMDESGGEIPNDYMSAKNEQASITRKVEAIKLKEKVLKIIEKSPSSKSEVFKHRWFRAEPTSYKELAKEFDVTPEAIRMREKRMLNALKAKLEI